MRTTLVTLLLAVAGFASPVLAQPTIESELARLNQTLERFESLFGSLIEQRQEDRALQRLDLAMRALELRHQAIRALRSRSEGLRDELRNADEQSTWINSELSNLDERLGDEVEDPKALSAMRYEMTRMAGEGRVLDERRDRLERELLDLDNEIADLQRLIDDLEAVVSRGLESLDSSPF